MPFKWEILSTPPIVLFEVPSEPIKTPNGAVVPARVLTMWDDTSLLAVGIRRTAVDDDANCHVGNSASKRLA
jgi:hypothetical protein